MPHSYAALSLRMLLDRGLDLSPAEAAAVTLAVGERIGWAEPPGVDAIALRSDGEVDAWPTSNEPARPEQYAQLLAALLEHVPSSSRIPGALLLTLSRALGQGDLPRIDSTARFAGALRRFAGGATAPVLAAALTRARGHGGRPVASSVPERSSRAGDRSIEGSAARGRPHAAASVPERAPVPPRAQAATAATVDDYLRRAPLHVDAATAAADDVVMRADAQETVGARVRRSPRRARVVAVAGAAVVVLLGMGAWWQHDEVATTGARLETEESIPSDLPALAADKSGHNSAVREARHTEPSVAGPPQPPARPAQQVVLPASTELRSVDGVRSRAYSPSFAPDGRSLYFHAEDGATSRLMRADRTALGDIGEVATVVDDGARNYHVRLSPDGTRVAFDSDRDGERAVFVAARDGSGLRRVSGDGYAAVPVWSPSGDALVVIRGEPGRPRVWNLWRLDLASGQQQRLTSHRSGQAWPGSWFADGVRVCYTHDQRLYIIDTRTGSARRFDSPVRGRMVRTAAASPDGRYIAFQVYRDGMWLLDLSNGAMRRVLNDPSAEEFAWSPDGRQIAFHSRRSGRWSVWVMGRPS